MRLKKIVSVPIQAAIYNEDIGLIHNFFQPHVEKFLFT